MTAREIVARGEGFTLAKMLDGDQDYLSERGDAAFDPDRDERPPLLEVFRLAITDETGVELLGDVTWHAVDYGPSVRSRAYDLGFGLLPAARGRGIGGAAMRALACYVFETTPSNRVQASTDVTNIPAQRALAKAGFTREGVVRGAQLRGGEHHDLVAYGLLRAEVTGEKLTASQNASAELDSRDG
ncbi:GNAT family N-acetyltransferase [Kibdelosporangium philippinense]|uniref:GNAT family N-acetyltransferase n=1 Tax=Kibdelosporangium philippinense TaxID=211113 RepID=A0ABS8ZH73_9PSEU|nr:GNAT family protein [Kibdelosporangium philippinense]MCE7005838.1 GNAT family N-acetyltransferase [Kibdelosporangium philippinense]